MTKARWLDLIKRARGRSPQELLHRTLRELRDWSMRYHELHRAWRLTRERLLEKLGSPSMDDLWRRLASRPYATEIPQAEHCRSTPAVWLERVLRQAKDALDHRVDLLGSGPVELGRRIDWLRDYKTGARWTPAYFRAIDYNNPEHPSDVKFPWELSRMQWLIPLGQAYLLTGEEKYAAEVRELLLDWDAANPYARTVNWACTMECALRILTWTWLFHTLHASLAWRDEAFRFRFLKMLYLHADFTVRHLEKSDVNGNHYTADAAGLVFAGLFFGGAQGPDAWLNLGTGILEAELPKQVYPDGVDYEASVPYHRLVTELFLYPAIYLQRCGQPVSAAYRERVTQMAVFSRAYTQPSGLVPFWGDADDARALPFGGQNLNDHRYLCNLTGLAFDVATLCRPEEAALEETFWWFGAAGLARCHEARLPQSESQAFAHGGFYVMRNGRDHVFIDCGPVGLAGRGGHGHNDCLSFEAVLDGTKLITDCGAYVYTASYKDRNLFRSTAYHNTPQIDAQEINRFVSPSHLWSLHYDAVPEVRTWKAGSHEDIFCGTHAGFRRLPEPVMPVRTITLDHRRHVLSIKDEFLGSGRHTIRIPLHLACGVKARSQGKGMIELQMQDRRFMLKWQDPQRWNLHVSEGQVSPGYGTRIAAVCLCWEYEGVPEPVFSVEIGPTH